MLRRLTVGARVACMSDAGTLAVSDPGAALVQAVAAAGYRVIPSSRRQQRDSRAQRGWRRTGRQVFALRLRAEQGHSPATRVGRRVRGPRRPGVARGTRTASRR